MKRIAILADVHGRILLAFKLVDRYQHETGKHIDLIFQCGDMGIFPDRSRMDKATVRHAQADDTEVGFLEHFASPNPEAEAVLSRMDCNLICVRGNHEDHAHLDRLEADSQEAIFPVDCYRRIYVLKTGVVYDAAVPEGRLAVLGIGRVGAPVGETELGKAKYIQEYERARLLALDEAEFDVLLTHDGRPGFAKPGAGMIEIELVLDQYRPIYHFFGHTGQPFERRADPNGFTIASKMSDCEWEEDRGKILKAGCFGVLHWHDRDHHELEIVAAPWIKEYTAHTWRYVG
jgi:hypothetical protein